MMKRFTTGAALTLLLATGTLLTGCQESPLGALEEEQVAKKEAPAAEQIASRYAQPASQIASRYARPNQIASRYARANQIASRY